MTDVITVTQSICKTINAVCFIVTFPNWVKFPNFSQIFLTNVVVVQGLTSHWKHF